LFGDPPKPDHLERLCAETVLTLNDAMCAYYIRPRAEGGCGEPLATAPTCPQWKQPAEKTCKDKEPNCPTWAHSGECANNPGFMLGSCPKACEQCDGQQLAAVPAWSRGLAGMAGRPLPAMRSVPAGGLGQVAGAVELTGVHAAEAAGASAVKLAEAKLASKLEAKLASKLEATLADSHSQLADSHKLVGATAAGSTPRLHNGSATRRLQGDRDLDPRAGRAHALAAGDRDFPPLSEDIGISAAAGGYRVLPHAEGDAAATSQVVEETVNDEISASEGGRAQSQAAEPQAHLSMATLRWQMYVGWVAILLLGAFIVGRRFCRAGRSKTRSK